VTDHDRGEYRGIYVALIDSPEFLELGDAARAVLLILKLKLGKSGIEVFYPEVLPRYTGMDAARVSEGLEQLKAADWIRTERNVFWLRNGLRFDPTNPLRVPNTRTSILAHLKTLPKLQIVRDFATYYELPDPFAAPSAKEPKAKGCGRVTEPKANTEDGRRKTEDGNGETTDSPGAGAHGGSFLARAIEAANSAMADNPAIDQSRLRAIPADHAASALVVQDWEACGITPDTALPVIHAKSRGYQPDRQHQITTLKYFDSAVREAHAARSGPQSRNGTHGHHRAGKPAGTRPRRGRIISE